MVWDLRMVCTLARRSVLGWNLRAPAKPPFTSFTSPSPPLGHHLNSLRLLVHLCGWTFSFRGGRAGDPSGRTPRAQACYRAVQSTSHPLGIGAGLDGKRAEEFPEVFRGGCCFGDCVWRDG